MRRELVTVEVNYDIALTVIIVVNFIFYQRLYNQITILQICRILVELRLVVVPLES